MKMVTRDLLRTRLICCAVAILGGAGAWAQDDGWETIVRDRNRQVQIDRNSIIQSDAGVKVAWGRVVLAPAEAAAAGYTTIQAMNRYDCHNRSFVTVKRRYLDAQNIVVREDDVGDQKPILVVRNSVDERLWSEVCDPPSTADLAEIAERAAQAAQGAEPAEPAVEPDRARPPPSPAVRPERTPAPVSERTAPSRLPSQADPERAPVREAGSVAQSADVALPLPVAPRAPVRSQTPPPIAPQAPTLTVTAEPVPRSAPKPSPRTAAGASGAARWSYAGDSGPEHWGHLRPEWALCANGRQQSPIDLTGGVVVDLDPPAFDYRLTQFRIVDVGTTLQVHVGEGMAVDLRGQRYVLMHFEFRRQSEHPVSGFRRDMSVLFHHRDAQGRQAIVEVMLDQREVPNPVIAALLNNLPLERGGEHAPILPIDPTDLLPVEPGHHLYMGSLPTPPCSEGVLWAVMKQPVGVSAEQLDIFARLYPANNRPLQAGNGRLVLESR